MQQQSPPMILPRGLIILAFFWLVLAWISAIGFLPPVHPSTASYEPGIKRMLMYVVIGLMVGWPLYRLSQRRCPWPIRQTVLDLIVLLSMTQVILWPLRLITSWTRERTAAIDTTIIFWSLLAGVIVASAIGSEKAGVRCLAMLACIATCVLAPAIAWVGVKLNVDVFDVIDMSPLLVIYTLGDGRGSGISAYEWSLIILLGIATFLGWLALLVAKGIIFHTVGRGSGRSASKVIS